MSLRVVGKEPNFFFEPFNPMEAVMVLCTTFFKDFECEGYLKILTCCLISIVRYGWKI